MPRTSTREKILRSAETLFARDGVDRVTLRQIGREASQRNVAAVQYHFGGKDDLLSEILDRHLAAIDARRAQMLETADDGDLEALLDVLVLPLVEKLDDASGRAYLRIQAQQPSSGAGMRPATRRMSARIRRALDAPNADPLRDRFAVLLLFNALADRTRREEEGEASPRSRRRFASSLSRAIRGIYRGGD